jgi:hypothetical protein
MDIKSLEKYGLTGACVAGAVGGGLIGLGIAEVITVYSHLFDPSLVESYYVNPAIIESGVQKHGLPYDTVERVVRDTYNGLSLSDKLLSSGLEGVRIGFPRGVLAAGLVFLGKKGSDFFKSE